MRRLAKGKCGYLGYVCKGLKKLRVLELPVSDTNVYTEDSTGRLKDNNYLNIPKQFLGVIHSTLFFDLQGIPNSIKIPDCFLLYDPFTVEGLYDFAGILSKILPMSAYTDAIKSYKDLTILKPGILRPKPRLFPFLIPTTVTMPDTAVPTVFPVNALPQIQSMISPYLTGIQAIQSQIAQIQSVIPRVLATQAQVLQVQTAIAGVQNIQAQVAQVQTAIAGVQAAQTSVQNIINNVSSVSVRASGCSSGFIILTVRLTGGRYIILISEGDVLLQVDSEGKPITQHVLATRSDPIYLANVLKLLVWIQAQYDITSSKWVILYLYIDADKSLDYIKPWTKRELLGTIQYSLMRIDIDQSKCSPIDMRDWVSLLTGQLLSSDSTIYVFYLNAKSGKKGWMPVKDC